MIRQELYISEYHWRIKAYYAVDTYYTQEIADSLVDIGCGGDYLLRAVENMDSGKLDHGLTYSNMDGGESVLVVGLTSSAAEFLNSLTHELHHLVCHISEARGIDITSEQSAYMAGGIARMMFPYVVELLCEHCRKH